MTAKRMVAGAAIFPRLKALGVDYVFCNSGTDFPPIIEGLAAAAAAGEALPQALVIPHENAAMAMAHGYYLMTGQPQAVMMHTNVGLANGAMGAINAAAEHVPVLMMSGRTPVTEQGRFGARTVPIGWGQEMRDQAALVREACKWDYELRFPEQITELLDRAHAIASSTPAGPVYLSLPREVLCEEIDTGALDAPPTMRPALTGPDPQAIRTLAGWLAGAEAPLIIAQKGVGNETEFAAFGQWCEDWGIAVSSWWPTRLALATDHPCHVGSDPGAALARADVVLCIDSLAPWMPDVHKLRPGAQVAHLGPDPLFQRFPVRNFPAGLAVTGETGPSLTALAAAMQAQPRDSARIAARRAKLAAISPPAPPAAAADAVPTKPQASRIVSDALEGRDAVVFNELGSVLGPMQRRGVQSWFDAPHSGGLGWSFPAVMGAQLAAPGRLCVATMGDGSYMFANPTVCHQIAEALRLPVLILIFNNAEWHAVRRSVAGLYPDGHAMRANRMPLVSLDPTPDFRKTAEASRAFALRAATAGELASALSAALDHIDTAGTCALIDIAIAS